MTYPLEAPIYTPTDKYSEQDRIQGICRAKEVFRSYESKYQNRLRKLKELCSCYDTCVVIGNGPSLNKIDLECLVDVPTFGANSIFLKYGETRFRPTFYVVEDHLVAEDRCEAINSLDGSIKLFPTYLSYCIEEDPSTIFYKHLPRKSYPHGFDFSEDASVNTYTGCTVTFSALQLAYYFGFRRILLVGLDHNYSMPKDLERSSAYGVGVLDMKSDDPNHFDPSYFGRGRRWHDPQVEKMEQAYQAAKAIFDRDAIEVLNCTIGGKLEVFPRAELVAALSRRAMERSFDRVAFLEQYLADGAK